MRHILIFHTFYLEIEELASSWTVCFSLREIHTLTVVWNSLPKASCSLLPETHDGLLPRWILSCGTRRWRKPRSCRYVSPTSHHHFLEKRNLWIKPLVQPRRKPSEYSSGETPSSPDTLLHLLPTCNNQSD